jgi:hypothetical protein
MDTTRDLRPGAATTGAFTPEFRSALPAVWLLATHSLRPCSSGIAADVNFVSVCVYARSQNCADAFFR